MLAAISAPAAVTAAESDGAAGDAAQQLLKDAHPIKGAIPLYQKDSQLLAEFGPRQLDQDYIVLISIARGIGQTPLLGGMTWSLEDDDWVWTFHKVEDRIQIVRRNVRFHADRGNPEATALANAFTDSVLFSLPIQGKGPQGGDLVDLTPVFMSDLPQMRPSDIIVDGRHTPDDARTVAAAELAGLRTRIDALLTGQVELDAYSKAHLQDTARRIEKILDAQVTQRDGRSN